MDTLKRNFKLTSHLPGRSALELVTLAGQKYIYESAGDAHGIVTNSLKLLEIERRYFQRQQSPLRSSWQNLVNEVAIETSRLLANVVWDNSTFSSSLAQQVLDIDLYNKTVRAFSIDPLFLFNPFSVLLFPLTTWLNDAKIQFKKFSRPSKQLSYYNSQKYSVNAHELMTYVSLKLQELLLLPINQTTKFFLLEFISIGTKSCQKYCSRLSKKQDGAISSNDASFVIEELHQVARSLAAFQKSQSIFTAAVIAIRTKLQHLIEIYVDDAMGPWNFYFSKVYAPTPTQNSFRRLFEEFDLMHVLYNLLQETAFEEASVALMNAFVGKMEKILFGGFPNKDNRSFCAEDADLFLGDILFVSSLFYFENYGKRYGASERDIINRFSYLQTSICRWMTLPTVEVWDCFKKSIGDKNKGESKVLASVLMRRPDFFGAKQLQQKIKSLKN